MYVIGSLLSYMYFIHIYIVEYIREIIDIYARRMGIIVLLQETVYTPLVRTPPPYQRFYFWGEAVSGNVYKRMVYISMS